MPRIKTERFGSGDQTWLASDHGIFNARTSVLDVSAFSEATHFPDGYFPSGLPVNAADEGAVKPWTGGEGEALGFVLTDQATDGVEDLNVPVIRHGLIKTNKLPVAFTAPKAAGQFTFVNA